MALTPALHASALRFLPPESDVTSSSHWKLVRAYQHLMGLDAEIDTWLQSDPWATRTEFDTQMGKYRVYIDLLVSVPDEFSLIIGDFLQNLRAVLDHMVHELGERHLGRPLTDKEARDSMFPIYCDKPLPPQESVRRLGSIDPAKKAAIEQLQPHTRSDTQYDFLCDLSELANRDKHRAVNVAIAYAGGHRLSALDGGDTAFGGVNGPRIHFTAGASIALGGTTQLTADTSGVEPLVGEITESGTEVLRYAPTIIVGGDPVHMRVDPLPPILTLASRQKFIQQTVPTVVSCEFLWRYVARTWRDLRMP